MTTRTRYADRAAGGAATVPPRRSVRNWRNARFNAASVNGASAPPAASAHSASKRASMRSRVNGPDAHPLYRYLTHAKRGFLWTRAIKWNFTKFLIDRKGNVVERYAPNVEPAAIVPDIEKLL